MSKNKILIVIIGISIVFVVGYVLYRQYKLLYPESTGAIVVSPPTEEVELGDVIKKMKDNLPIVLGSFQIQSYDYKSGKFIVTLNTGSDVDFYNWLSTSEFSAIPKKMFVINP